MTSLKQIEANRRNSLKSTGPKTEAGKRASRCNAVRHGLTAETVIGALEDAEDYKGFEAAIIADYDAQSAVERELVLRLASLLWRLRRATTIETGLFEIQADHLSNFRRTHQTSPAPREIVYELFNANSDRQAASYGLANATETSPAGEHARLGPLPAFVSGGPQNPMGARGLYLYSGGQDTQYRIHGTNQPEYIGRAISSGCIRMTNEDVIELYNRVEVGTIVVVLAPTHWPFAGTTS